MAGLDPLSAEARLEWILGDWAVMREIEDRRAVELGVFEGAAVFERDGDVVRYREEGLLRLPGRAPLRAERAYIWSVSGSWIEVAFGDGRPFHRFAPGGGCAAHYCEPDRYRVRYVFGPGAVWEATWDVSGPRKDYSMRTNYCRG